MAEGQYRVSHIICLSLYAQLYTMKQEHESTDHCVATMCAYLSCDQWLVLLKSLDVVSVSNTTLLF